MANQDETLRCITTSITAYDIAPMCIDSKIKVYEHNPLESLMRMDEVEPAQTVHGANRFLCEGIATDGRYQGAA